MKYYKYVTHHGVDILRHNRIKVSDFSQTNDPFEILPRIDYPTDRTFWDQQFEQHVANDPVFAPAKRAKLQNLAEYERQRTSFISGSISERDRAMRELPQRLRDGYATEVGFVCLTTKPNDIVMWGHYADCHRGLVIEFDANNVFFVNFVDTDGNKLRVFPVDYTDMRPVLKVGDPFRPELMACKGKTWKYEDEVRILFHKGSCVQDGADIFFPLPPDCITGVILGARAPEDLCREVMSLNQEKWNGKLSVSNAVEDPEEYRILIQGDRSQERGELQN